VIRRSPEKQNGLLGFSAFQRVRFSVVAGGNLLHVAPMEQRGGIDPFNFRFSRFSFCSVICSLISDR
jgi:hypothetical protein